MHTTTSHCSVHLLNAGRELDAIAQGLQTAVLSTWTRAAPLLPLASVDVVVYHDPSHTIPEFGIGGYTPSARRVLLAVDATQPDVHGPAFTDRLGRLLAHELHHCARWAGPGYGTTLGEALVSEGLACLFETEVFGGPPPFYVRALTPAQLHMAEEHARAGRAVAAYDHALWFYGSEPQRVPRHAGYALGYAVAMGHAQRQGRSAAQLAHEPAERFWECGA